MLNLHRGKLDEIKENNVSYKSAIIDEALTVRETSVEHFIGGLGEYNECGILGGLEIEENKYGEYECPEFIL